mgnify:CR=1 FL=1
MIYLGQNISYKNKNVYIKNGYLYKDDKKVFCLGLICSITVLESLYAIGHSPSVSRLTLVE